MATLADTARSGAPTLRVAVGAVAGGVWATLAWWLTDMLVRELNERLALAVTDAGGVLILLGLLAIGLVSLGVALSSRAGALAGGAVLIAGLILGGYGSGTALMSLNGDLGFILLRGAHEPAMYMLLGAWIGGLGWSLLWGPRLARRSGPASRPALDTSTAD